MGANEFHSVARGKTPDEAFKKAREDAQYESGHGGYTGTIAEKHSFVMIGTVAKAEEASTLADKLLNEDDRRISDKWGPAGCIEITGRFVATGKDPKKSRQFLFFGWASS